MELQETICGANLPGIDRKRDLEAAIALSQQSHNSAGKVSQA
jgi:hypothetical protein